MPKEKNQKKAGPQLRHAPLGVEIDQPVRFTNIGTIKAKSNQGSKNSKLARNDKDRDDGEELDAEDDENPKNYSKVLLQSDEYDHNEVGSSEVQRKNTSVQNKYAESDGSMTDDEKDAFHNVDDYDGDEDFVQTDKSKEFVEPHLSEVEEAVVQKFLSSSREETRSLADIIMQKLREREEGGESADANQEELSQQADAVIPMKVTEVYTAVGQMLKHYKSGKLPKALKMLPHLKNWEHVLWMTRPDQWSAAATYAATRIFASNLNVKMAQRFYNLVLLEKCRDDIRSNNKLSYYHYLALKKALFKPAAFYKGLLLPLVLSRTCTLREATIIGSVLAKVSIPGNHSAAVLLRLAEMPYYGSTSFFIRILLNKKYALPRRVVDALVDHFCAFETDSRALPVVWHQSLLVFAQRYKLELSDSQKERMKQLLRCQQHHQITPEVRREIFQSTSVSKEMEVDTVI